VPTYSLCRQEDFDAGCGRERGLVRGSGNGSSKQQETIAVVAARSCRLQFVRSKGGEWSKFCTRGEQGKTQKKQSEGRWTALVKCERNASSQTIADEVLKPYRAMGRDKAGDSIRSQTHSCQCLPPTAMSGRSWKRTGSTARHA